MNILNIQSLTAALTAMGFGEDIGHKLLQQVCLNPAKFALTERLFRARDILTCTLFFEKKNEEYHCDCYEVSLLREMDSVGGVPPVNVFELDRRMADIDWSEAKEPGSVNLSDESSWGREKAIEAVVLDLFSMSETEAGKYVADYLRLKYWYGVPLLSAMYNLHALRAKYEISQRFYFFDNQGISIEEAYRFLLNRWMEKRLQAKRKLSTGDGSNGEFEEAASQHEAGAQKRKSNKKKLKK